MRRRGETEWRRLSRKAWAQGRLRPELGSSTVKQGPPGLVLHPEQATLSRHALYDQELPGQGLIGMYLEPEKEAPTGTEFIIEAEQEC